jgi:hypothetical protein
LLKNNTDSGIKGDHMISAVFKFIFLIFIVCVGILIYLLVTSGVAAFLQALGIMAGLLVLMLIAGWFVLRLFFAKISKSLQELAGSVTPRRVTLKRAAEIKWENADAVTTITRELEALGFNTAAEYEIEEMPAVKLVALTHVPESVYAVVYEMAPVGVWYDLVTEVRDDETLWHLTYNNNSNKNIGLLDKPPTCINVKADLSIDALFKRMISERLKGTPVQVSAERFKPVFENAYAEEQDWRDARGGPSEEEVRRVAAASGQQNVTDEVFKSTREQLTTQALCNLDESLRERFVAETRMPASDWETVRQRIVIIHDKLRPVDVLERLNMYDEGEGEHKPEDVPSGTPRELFKRYNEKRPVNKRFKLLGTVEKPLSAEIFEQPNFS